MKTISMYRNSHQGCNIFLPKALILWILNHVTSPISGFEHKRNSSGKYLSSKEQVSATQFQLLLLASDYYSRGQSIEKIMRMLSVFIHDENA